MYQNVRFGKNGSHYGAYITLMCRRALVALWPLMLAIPPFFLPITYMYLTFQCQWHDYGALFNIINNLFELGYFYSPDWGFDHFNVHFTPFFYILSPIIHVSDSLLFYLLLHSFAIVTSIWIYYRFAKKVLKSSPLATLSYIALLVNPYFMAANLYTHFEVFMVLTLMGFALFAVKGKVGMALVCLAIALSVKEDVWIYGIGASFILLHQIPVRHMAVYVGTSISYYILILYLLYPILYPNSIDFFLQLWAYGPSKGAVIQYLVTHPWETGKRLITGSGLDFNLLYLFVPFLSGWRLLPSLAVLYLWLNSTDVSRSYLAFYYNLPCVVLYAITLPFALINLERFWCCLRSRFPHMIQARIATQTILFAVIIIGIVWQIRPPPSLMQSPSLSSIFAEDLKIGRFFLTHRTINRVLTNREKAVLASFAIGAYVPPRDKIFIMTNNVVYLMQGSWRPDFVVFDLNKSGVLISEELYRQFFAYMQTSPEYRQVEDVANVVIFAKQ